MLYYAILVATDIFRLFYTRHGMVYSMLPYFPDAPISGHFDFTFLHFVVKRKQIRTMLSKDLSTSLLSFVLFTVELRFV